jgi:riboflavin-specific deaminase-like protein
MSGEALRLYPKEGPQAEGTEIYGDLDLPGSGRGGPGKPYVFINMVSSLDGNTNMEGKASGIGTGVDRLVMRTLRSKADAVMIGAGTLRAEKLSLGLDDGDANPSPLAVIVSGTGDVPLESNLLRYAPQRVLVLVSGSVADTTSANLGHHAEVLSVRTTATGSLDLAFAIEMLRSEYTVERLLVEGGPTLNHALISHSLADELFVTLAPTLLGTDAVHTPTILDGPLDRPQSLRLLSAYLAADELFLRYALI